MLFLAVIVFYLTNNVVSLNIVICLWKFANLKLVRHPVNLYKYCSHTPQLTMLGVFRVCYNASISEALGFDFERLYWCVGLARTQTMNNILFISGKQN